MKELKMIEINENEWTPIAGFDKGLIDRSIITRREDVALLFLTALPGSFYTTTQLQKALFLISQNIPDICTTPYNFIAADYGPSDHSISQDMDKLIKSGVATKVCDATHSGFSRHLRYAATYDGFEFVDIYKLKDKHEDYIYRVAKWILSMDMISLVGAIVRAYPDYGTNMIFRNN